MLSIILKKFVPKIKPALQKLIAQGKEIQQSIELEKGEVTVVGLITIENDKCHVLPCTVRVAENGKLQVSRVLHKYDVEELVELLISNIGKTDLLEE